MYIIYKHIYNLKIIMKPIKNKSFSTCIFNTADHTNFLKSLSSWNL